MENMLVRPRGADIYSPHLRSGVYLKVIAIADHFGQFQTRLRVPNSRR